MSVAGKVFTKFRPYLSFSLFSKCNKTCAVLSTRSRFRSYSTLKSPLQRGFHLNIVQTKSSQVRAMAALSPLDPSSFSRPEIAIVTHTSLSLNVDFENKVLSGFAVLTVDILRDTQEVILDARNLTIESVELENGTALKYTSGEEVPNFGSKLTIKLAKNVTIGENDTSEETPSLSSVAALSTDEVVTDHIKMGFAYSGFFYEPADCTKSHITLTNHLDDKSCLCCECRNKNKNKKEMENTLTHRTIENTKDKSGSGLATANTEKNQDRGVKIKITYATAPSASGLQWLEPSQTSGKQHPYLFSQCQPIHARSIMPCQDTPAVKFTYDATVTAPAPFTVVMSALRSPDGRASFRQPVPVPAYLIAIAVGVLESRQLGPRSMVWSEKEEIERSAWEFAETERYLAAAEALCGRYEWTQYDLLVLPSSFPYGGMENPCLTFVTPTLLAGDRSQADVLVHEIMHSWTGNLVTNRNFEHFWLNEGFTVFLERKVAASLIADPVEAKRSRDFHSLLGLQELNETVNYHLGADSPLSKLVVNLKGVHPDDAFSRVPYEKGSLFLRYLEDLVGGPAVFDDFIRAYLSEFRRKSLDTFQFKAFLLEYFQDHAGLKTVNWDDWLNKPGMPPIIPDYDYSMTKAIKSLLGKIEQDDATLSESDVSGFSPHQMINLLQELVDRPALPKDKLLSLGQMYKVDNSTNSEILYRWLRLCVRSRDTGKLPAVFQFLNTQGRMKYVRPIYRDLYAWEEVRQQAIDNFLKNEKYMMHVSAYTVRKDLHLSG